jgi:hypothetical protein
MSPRMTIRARKRCCSRGKVQKLRDEGKSLDEVLATNLTAPYDGTTEGDTRQS